MMYPWQSFGAHQQPKDFTDKILYSSDFRESFAAKREGQHAHARRGDWLSFCRVCCVWYITISVKIYKIKQFKNKRKALSLSCAIENFPKKTLEFIV